MPEQNVLSGSELVSVGAGKAWTVLVIAEEVAEHPLEFVTITSTIWPLVSDVVINVFEVLFWILVPFILKLKLVPPPAVNVTDVPEQKILSASELESVGNGRAYIVTNTDVRVVLTHPVVIFLAIA